MNNSSGMDVSEANQCITEQGQNLVFLKVKAVQVAQRVTLELKFEIDLEKT